jgi:hypothetical protein
MSLVAFPDITPELAYDSIIEFLGLPHVGYPNFRRRNTRLWSPLVAPGVLADCSVW